MASTTTRTRMCTGFKEWLSTDMVTNGAFAADSDWTKDGAEWTIAGGVGVCDGNQAAASSINQDITALEGHLYRTAFTATRDAGTITLLLGDSSGTARATADTFEEDIVRGDDSTLYLEGDADYIGTVDDVTVQDLTFT